MPRNITTETFTVEHNGKPLDILHVHGTHAEEHGVDGVKCFICGFKPRKGAHTYWVHIGIGPFVKGVDIHYELLPFFDDEGNNLNDDGTEISLGWWEVGAECRKRLPEKFVLKKKKEET